MAVEVYCDYCGEEIEGRFASVEVGGISDPRSVERDRFQYHPEPAFDRHRACYELATRSLADMREWAYGEKSESTGWAWELHRMPRASLAPNPQMMSTDPVRGSLSIGEAELHPQSALALRRAGVRTLEEAAERSQLQLLGIDGVAATTMRKLAEALRAHGLAFREGPTPEQLGARIRQLRETAGLRRGEVAHAVRSDGDEKLYETDLAAWEAGRRVPTARRLERLAAAFGVAVDQLTDAEEAS